MSLSGSKIKQSLRSTIISPLFPYLLVCIGKKNRIMMKLSVISNKLSFALINQRFHIKLILRV